jgi:hypothetical protein
VTRKDSGRRGLRLDVRLGRWPASLTQTAANGDSTYSEDWQIRELRRTDESGQPSWRGQMIWPKLCEYSYIKTLPSFLPSNDPLSVLPPRA